MKSALAVYAKGTGRYPLLSEQEEDRLLTEYAKTRSATLAKRIAEGNLRLVMTAARSLRVRSEQVLEDVIQEGNLGLLEAVQRFDRGHGVKFSTFATEWIRGAMLHFLTIKTRQASREAPLDEGTANAVGYHDARVDLFLRKRLQGFGASLRGRDRDIFERRLCAARPLRLAAFARRHRISCVRVREIEQRLLRQIRRELRPAKRTS